jgi:hypothetical protein
MLPLSLAGVADVSQPPEPPQAPPAAVGAVATEDPLVRPVELVTPDATVVAVTPLVPYAELNWLFIRSIANIAIQILVTPFFKKLKRPDSLVLIEVVLCVELSIYVVFDFENEITTIKNLQMVPEQAARLGQKENSSKHK